MQLEKLSPLLLLTKKNDQCLFFLFSSEVLLGEHIVGRDPDCTSTGGERKCAPKRIVRRVQKFKLHEKWQNSDSTGYARSYFIL